MKLLILTQKMDRTDAVLGFMHGWVEAFARQSERVTVVCLERGVVALSETVTVLSLGKEKGYSRVRYSLNFYRYIWNYRHEYDAVLVHMNPEYIVLGGLLWRIWNKPVSLWYAHKSVPWHLRLAHVFINVVFTSTASGFRLPSKKVSVIGQGIDTDRFKIGELDVAHEGGVCRIVTVGRITPAKDYDTLLDAVEIVVREGLSVRVDIFGPASIASDKSYLAKLKAKVIERRLTSIVFFQGPVMNTELPSVFEKVDVFVNMGLTGSMDKAVPEAMACGLPILTCNEAFTEVLGDYADKLMYPKGDAHILAEKIKMLARLSELERQKMGALLREIVVEKHSLRRFVAVIVEKLTVLLKRYE